jgi:polyhydroxyalkanoate synthase
MDFMNINEVIIMKSVTNSLEEFSNNLVEVSKVYQLIIQKLLEKQSNQDLKPALDPLNLTSAINEVLARIYSEPERLVEFQMKFSNSYLELINNTISKFMGQNDESLYKPLNKDNRFKDEAWQNNIYFDFIKQSYLMSTTMLQQMVASVDGIDNKTSQKAMFYIKQLTDALAPTNFLLTNPQVLKETVASQGDNLVKGLSKMLADIERSKRFIDIETNDTSAFEVGVNIAATKGKVIFQNDLMQLIHYTPTQKNHFDIPLLIVPPCINKFYILDTKEQNSFVKWSLDQGYNLFIISWVNPGKDLSHKDFEDYMLEGPLAAIDAIFKATNCKEINTIGYCIGGTILASTLAYMKKKKDNRVKSATFLTTLLDFANAGELSIFIDDAQLEVVEKRMNMEGFFAGEDMANAFNMLRANDMIWSSFINNYLLGKEPISFDLLYWNSDTTRMAAKMHSFYLRNLYQKNLLVKPNAISLNGVKIDLSKIDIPCYFLSTREDHIAPWQSTFEAVNILSGDVTFTLAASGHIAGVINHPHKNKYCYWVNNKKITDSEKWLDSAKEHQGSWWEHWNKWCSKKSGDIVKAMAPGKGKLPVIEDAPGSYVRVR